MQIMSGQSEKAERLRSFHHGPPILVLPNAWDAASARMIEDAGFPAVATTSAGIAISMGFQDGAALAAGAVGMNLEDSWERGGRTALAAIALQEDRIQAAREAAESAGIPLVLNARTDVFLRSFGEESTRFDEAVRRLNGYLAAGADCAFPILVRDPRLIADLVEAIKGPVNVLAGPGAPEIPELEMLGVARVSFGSGLMRAALSLTRRIAKELKASGTYRSFPEDTVPSPEANRLFARSRGE
jgi:2-methylisocitrate lyase-like PEP mutase family enzyme